MWWLVQRLRGDPGPLHFGAGHVAHYVQVLVTIRGVEHARWAVQIPDDPQVLAKMRAMPGADVMPGDQVRLAGAAPRLVEPANAITEAASLVTYLQAAARRRGWSDTDLDGTAIGGDPGDQGGRSPRSGLNLAELALVQPPPDWADLVARGRPPWESAMWTPPSPSWRAPGWAPMAAPTPAIDPEIPAETFLPPRQETEESEIPDPEPVPTTPEPAPTFDALPGWEGTDEELREVTAIVLDLARRQGKAPHVNAVRFHTNRAGLPKLTTEQIETICARGTT